MTKPRGYTSCWQKKPLSGTNSTSRRSEEWWGKNRLQHRACKQENIIYSLLMLKGTIIQMVHLPTLPSLDIASLFALTFPGPTKSKRKKEITKWNCHSFRRHKNPPSLNNHMAGRRKQWGRNAISSKDAPDSLWGLGGLEQPLGFNSTVTHLGDVFYLGAAGPCSQRAAASDTTTSSEGMSCHPLYIQLVSVCVEKVAGCSD